MSHNIIRWGRLPIFHILDVINCHHYHDMTRDVMMKLAVEKKLKILHTHIDHNKACLVWSFEFLNLNCQRSLIAVIIHTWGEQAGRGIY